MGEPTLIIATVSCIKRGDSEFLTYSPRNDGPTMLTCTLTSGAEIRLQMTRDVVYSMNSDWAKYGPPFVIMNGDIIVAEGTLCEDLDVHTYAISNVKSLFVPLIGDNITAMAHPDKICRLMVAPSASAPDVPKPFIDKIAEDIHDISVVDHQVWQIMSSEIRAHTCPIMRDLADALNGKVTPHKMVKKWFKMRLIRALQGVGIDLNAFNYMHKIIESPITIMKTIMTQSPHLVPYLSYQQAETMCMSLGFSNTPEQKTIGAWRRLLWEQMEKNNCTYVMNDMFNKILVEGAVYLPDAQSETIVSVRDHALQTQQIFYSNSYNLDKFYLPVILALETIIGRQMSLLSQMNKFEYTFDLRSVQCDVRLTSEQCRAVTNSIREPISVLIGPAGSGKSTTTGIIVAEMVKCGMRVCLTSFTGKAVCRLKQICRDMGITYHRAATIDMLMTKDEFNFDAFIVDEVSMVNLTLLKAFFQRILVPLCDGKYRLRDNVSPLMVPRLLFIGDSNQLPPISNGSTIDALMRSVPVSMLSQVHRSTTHGISHACNAALTRSVLMSDYDDYDIDNIDDAAIWKLSVNTVEDVVNAYDDLSKIYGRDEVVIITPMNRDVDAINAMIVERQHGSMHPVPWLKMKVGTPVMMTKNDEKIDLVNGSVGIIKSFNRNTTTVTFNEGDEERDVTFNNRQAVNRHDKLVASNLRVCYAFTVHKSQGSEWKAVIFYYPVGCKMLTCELFYVATSRPRELLVIASQEFNHINQLTKISGRYFRCNTVHERVSIK